MSAIRRARAALRDARRHLSEHFVAAEQSAGIILVYEEHLCRFSLHHRRSNISFQRSCSVCMHDQCIDMQVRLRRKTWGTQFYVLGRHSGMQRCKLKMSRTRTAILKQVDGRPSRFSNLHGCSLCEFIHGKASACEGPGQCLGCRLMSMTVDQPSPLLWQQACTVLWDYQEV